MSDVDAPHVTLSPQTFVESGPKAGSSGSTKVGWTLRDSHGRVRHGYAFSINPQGLTRSESSRAQLYATKAAFYVDDFGPGPPKISLRQLVGSGSSTRLTDGTVVELFTLREDVQRFVKTIWQPATRTRDPLDVYFHDNHFERGHDEHVYFPPDGLSIQRSTDLQNVWLVELQMIGLEVNPLGDVHADEDPAVPPGPTHRYIVRGGDTLLRIVHRLMGSRRDVKLERSLLARILTLNPQIKHKRHLYPGAPAYVGVAQVTGLPMKLIPGEVLILP